MSSNEHEYAVWAPEARQVEVHIGTGEPTAYPMERGDDGWWRLETDPGDGRYAFAVDGGMARPDPRSLSQPDGVHAASALVETDFTWTDQDWAGVELPDAVVYELHVGTFTPDGTLDAAIEHLDHLVDLGVTVIELLPLAAFPGQAGWGYDGVCLYAVHEVYGGIGGLHRFVDAAHGSGLAVWLDVVYNHLGPDGNYLSELGPYFTDQHHTPWGEAVNLDAAGSDEVRAWICDNVRLWLDELHLDGLRLDAVHELHDRRAVHVLEQMAALADEIAEQTGVLRTLVAESDRNDPGTVSPRRPGGSGGLGLHGQWADDVHHALHVVVTGETQGYYADFADPAALDKVLSSTPFLHDGTYSTFRGRAHGREVDPDVTPGWRFVAALQTHDQIGNRAVGERVAHLVSPGMAAIGAALLLTSPYTPMLFMGEEWAASTPWQYFTDHEQDWLAESIREGRAREFAEHGWSQDVPDPQSPDTVTASTLHWAEVHEGEHARMLGWHCDLLRLRREQPALRDTPLGETVLHHDVAAQTLMLRRGEVTVVANLGVDEQQVQLPGEVSARHTLARWGQDHDVEGGHEGDGDSNTVRLGGHDVVVLGPEPS
ncbi:MAG: malto-oligosyltrehalose trehalohydrolase [Ornithinimicrobium sp.]|uniref:malto-oligosyltrehalose trehalohydrolase n=1 Tax=Ornithinimicrobium sp. TaxID=1977084 RepID=UPI003D9BE26F